MSFPRYPAYKPSGVEWLGEVPEHWEVTQLKWQIHRNDGGVWGLDPDGESTDTIVLRSTEQTVDGKWQLDEPAMRRLSLSEKASSILLKDDLVITKSSGSSAHIGKTTLVTDEVAALNCCYSNFMQRLRLRSGFDPKLAWYALNNELIREQFDFLSNSTTGLANLNGAMIGQVLIPLAPRIEQSAIATFLDRETAKIDALIAEQQRLIELLQEKRQAVISHAVTKGLNPDAPMKDSGVEWLGEVPEHWKTRAIKHLVSTPVTDGPHETPELVDEGVPFISAEAVSSGTLDFDKKRGFITREEHERFSMKYSPAKHDIYMVKSGATTGATAIVETDDEFNIWSPLAAIRCGNKINPYYLLAFMRSQNFQSAVMLGWNFGTQQNIGMKVIENLAVAVPPPDEQRACLDHLETLISPIETQIELAKVSTSLLRERRSALISATVTGQIDVRGLVPEAEAA